MKTLLEAVSGFLSLAIIVVAAIPWVSVYMAEEALEEGGLRDYEDTWQWRVADTGTDFMDSFIGDIVYEIPVELTDAMINDETTVKEAMAIVGFFTFIECWIVAGVILFGLRMWLKLMMQDDYVPSPPGANQGF